MRVSHSSSFSTGRAFSAGNEPTMPALHWAMTSSGPDTMNSGAPTTGSSSRPCSEAGSGIDTPYLVAGACLTGFKRCCARREIAIFRLGLGDSRPYHQNRFPRCDETLVRDGVAVNLSSAEDLPLAQFQDFAPGNEPRGNSRPKKIHRVMRCQNSGRDGRRRKAARGIDQRTNESSVQEPRILSELAAPGQLQFRAAFRLFDDLNSEPFIECRCLRDGLQFCKRRLGFDHDRTSAHRANKPNERFVARRSVFSLCTLTHKRIYAYSQAAPRSE